MSDCDTLSHIVYLISLSEGEEEAIRSVFKEDLQLQQDEENRLKKLHDDIDTLVKRCPGDDTYCSCCGEQFGVITNRGASCPTCTRRVCKKHRLFGSCSDSWMCTLCDMRKRLLINEEVLSTSVDDVFYVSFSDEVTPREKHNVQDKRCPKHLQQSKGQTHKDCHLKRSVGSKRQQQKHLKPEEKLGNRPSVKSPDRTPSPKQHRQTSTTKKQHSTTTTCLNINKPKIATITKSLLRSSIKRSSTDKDSKAIQLHPVVDNRQETDSDSDSLETSFPFQCDKKTFLDKNEDELQASTKKINSAGNGKKAGTPEHIGELRVMIQFVPDANKSGKEKGRGSLNVWIQQARGLPAPCDQGTYLHWYTLYFTAVFLPCSTLLPRGKYEKFKSAIIQCSSNPIYNTMYQFDKVTDVELLCDRVLEITIWEPHRNTNEFVGGVRLGPKPQAGNKSKWMDSVGSEVSQWETMMADPNQWIDGWHPLRCLIKK